MNSSTSSNLSNTLWCIPQNSAHNAEKEAALHTHLHYIVEQHQYNKHINNNNNNSNIYIKFACSLGAEDVVLLHAMHNLIKQYTHIHVFVLDTGRLHAQTLSFMQQLMLNYNLHIHIYTPEIEKINNYVETHGLNAFYDNLDRRKECCYIRKVEPLGRALQDACAWLTGQRQSQSSTRSELAFKEIDAAHKGIIKYNPLFDWCDEDIWGYIQYHNILIHSLHNLGYPSIGCEPCTRPIRMHENIRAGRWWWEDENNKECGLHIKQI
jgi:phosphoadenosine phosphosulfate reductase